MPFYEYECQACKFYTEVMQKITDTPLQKCPSCGKKTLKKLVSAPVFRLKGGGWYETDFKGDKENKRNLAGADRDEPKADTKTETKSDSKAETKSDSKTEAKTDAKESKPESKEAKPPKPSAAKDTPARARRRGTPAKAQPRGGAKKAKAARPARR
jgi:putative FmdB family regulatory protein